MQPTLAQAASALFNDPSRHFTVRLWDGAVLPPPHDEDICGEVVLTRPAALGLLFPPISERRVADAFLDGDIELRGDAIRLIEAAARWRGPKVRPAALRAVAALARGLLASARPEAFVAAAWRRLHSIGRDRDAVQHHYDVSDELYRLFLDPEMVYSCAYFDSGDESLEEAQRAKLELVCRKLRLRGGERLLDVGCGWGALLAHAAATHGVEGIGITVSDHQLAEARRRFGAAGGSRLTALATDYRRLPPGERFDKVASIGMMEHVGRDRLGEYFGAIARHLAPGGLLLNHAIADTCAGSSTIPWAGKAQGGFIGRYIFPDGDLVPLHLVLAAAEKAGFEVLDVESLQQHYAETLAEWLARLEARFAEAQRIVGTRRARAYRLYLASSAAAFRLGRISVYQTLLARRARDRAVEGRPRSRAEWYRGLGSSKPAQVRRA
ncbi:cyclopropane-fatty-acyl-phospholipid synthase family protein [Anaeromyxobacter sp. PSR-1]|uniref:SAM-dependent methyltransferase n=1 Tax=Anaeromyxobacter sp. PSR-1 TaxID=1300915 RepID=UPI0005E5A1B3|nr:cyclopropane-fatty-acyl-phospholipid synthase family protein [Anaeromyxobacter sp. PSR-1]GAO01251.1 putative fatty acid methyltransferase [Anaeromyxobacter sp. PSR-1]